MARKKSNEEIRTARISLLLTPTLGEKISLLADSQGITVNAFVESLLEKAVAKNADVINEFKIARETAKQKYLDLIDADV